jgi:hypothetical protein
MEYCTGKVDRHDNPESSEMLPFKETFDAPVTSAYLSVVLP